MSDFPQELKYSESHEYTKIEKNIAIIGITDYATGLLGDIVYIELPKIGDYFSKGETFGVIESVKSVSDLYSPVSGKVADINDKLTDTPELLSEDPYEKGWIISIEMDNPDEPGNLMDSEAYKKLVISHYH